MVINIDRGETAPHMLYEYNYGAQSVDITFNEKHPHIERDYADAGIMSMHVAHALADIATQDTRWRNRAFKEPEDGWAGGAEDQRRQVLAELLFDWAGVVTREAAE